MPEEEESSGDSIEDLDEIKRYYPKSDDYRIIPATGVKGGVQYEGNVLLDFVVDKNPQTEFDILDLTEEGLGDVIESEEETAIYRESQVGVNMSQRHAFSVATWVISNLIGPEVSESDIAELIQNEYPEHID